jgi:hypothetical protein
MIAFREKKIVLLGMITRMPVSGVIWQTAHYLLGLKRLGYDVFYVEAHGCTPTSFMDTEDASGCDRAADFLAGVMRRFGLEDRWAYHAVHEKDRCYGLSKERLRSLYGSAELLINLHGGTVPLPEHEATGRLVYLETDPVELQVELQDNLQRTLDFLSPHVAFFTFGENYGRTDCKLPVTDRFDFWPTRQPVLLDLWDNQDGPTSTSFTTIGNWRQLHREVHFEGDVYHWSKHYEFLKFIDLPRRTKQVFELALSSYGDNDRNLLERKGWRVLSAEPLSLDLDSYRSFIVSSRAEFTVAKDQNVRLRTGWFSDRSATYLAAGCPVVTQETGFCNSLPTGRGLFGYSTLEEIVRAVEEINADYARHTQAARTLAQEFFSHDVVLRPLLGRMGM